MRGFFRAAIFWTVGISSGSLAQSAMPAIVEINLGDTVEQAVKKLRAVDPQIRITPHVFDQARDDLPDIPYSIIAQVQSEVGKSGQRFEILLSSPSNQPQRVVAIFREWNAVAYKPIAWSQMLQSLDSRFGSPMNVRPQRAGDSEHEQWFFSLEGKPSAPPSAAATCTWHGGFLKAFQTVMINNGAPPTKTDSYLIESTHIDPRCGRMYQTASFGTPGTDLRTTFYATLIDTGAYYRALRDYTELMSGMQRGATRREEQEAARRGLPQQ